MYQLTFTLKQHTPLLHFLHEQDGAGLRSTEVKPKLDKYLRQRLAKDGKNAQDFQTKPSNNSLNYQLCFTCEKKCDYIITPSIPNKPRNPDEVRNDKLYKQDLNDKGQKYILETGYFADADKITKKDLVNIKRGIFYKNITGSVRSRNKVLLEYIKTNLFDFFVVTNFGARTSKAFGSFTLESINGSIIEKGKDVLNSFKNTPEIEAVYTCSFKTDPSLENILKSIASDAQILKSGINKGKGNPQNKIYIKSLLFRYFCKEHDIRWEKRWIKQSMGGYNHELKRNHEPIDCDCSNNNKDFPATNFAFTRALLGLAETNEYILEDRNSGKFIVEIDHEQRTIHRFQSPITFKVIDTTVYMIVNDSYKAILDQSFSFKLLRKSKNENKTELMNLGILKTPKTFELVDFLDSTFEYLTNLNEGTLEKNQKCEDDLQDNTIFYDEFYKRNEHS